MASYGDMVKNHSLNDFDETQPIAPTTTEETRAAGLEASELVAGDQAIALFHYLVQARNNEWGGLTNNELCRMSGFKINAVTARIVDLRRVEIGVSRDCLVEAHGSKTDAITGVSNIVWRVNPIYFDTMRRVV